MNDTCFKCPSLLRIAKACPATDSLASSWARAGVEAVNVVASLLSGSLAFIFFGTLLTRLRSARLLLLSAACFMAHISALGIKFLLRGHRPLGSCSESFGMPSNHAAVSVATAVIWTKMSCRYKLVCWVMAVLACFSRWWLNYHSPTQVVVGGLLGLAVGLFTTKLSHFAKEVAEVFQTQSQMEVWES